MTKRNTRNRRHGTNEIVVDGRKGRTSPTGSNSENQEYTMIDLVRSVEKLHLCKRSGERKDTVLWADVKKHYKKHTGRVLSTEAFNRLAGVSGVSRKELIAGPLAGLLVAEDPAALVIRFKYDANKGDPLINHRFYLEAAGAKTSVHNAADAVSPRRLADLTNTVSPSRSDISSSLSPTCVSSISTDPDTDAFSPVSAASPLSSAPLSPEAREYVTANDDVAASGEQSFLTARTSPITSDWDTSSSSRGASATPDLLHNRSNDQERTLNLLDVSVGPAETTIGAREVLVDMDAPVKEESKREEEKAVEREEEKKVKEDLFEEESDKENHVESQPAAKPQELPAAATPVPAAPAAVPEAVAEQQKDDDVVIQVPEAVEEIVIETSPAEEEKTDDAIEQPVEEEKLQPEHVAAVESVAEEVKGEQREEKEPKEGQEEEQDPAAGDCPVPTSPIVEAAASLTLDEALLQAASPVTTSSSDETLLTVIERVHCGTVQLQEEEEEEEEKMHEEPTEIKLQQQLLQPEDTVEDMEVDEVEEKVVVVVEKKEEQLAAGDVSAAVTAAVADSIEQPKEEEETVAVVEVVEAVAKKEEEERKEEKEEEVMREKREASRVEEDQQVESTPVEQPEDAARKEEEEEAVVDTVEKKIEAAPEVLAVPESEDVATVDTASDTTDEPTTMVAAASVAPLQQMQPVEQQPQPVLTQPEPQQPPLPTHEPMTSDDVEMNDVLVGGPNTDVHTPSVTAPITLQPKPVSKAQPEDDTEVITSQPVDELDSAPAAAAASPSKEDTAATPDLALRRAAPAKKFPCCTIV